MTSKPNFLVSWFVLLSQLWHYGVVPAGHCLGWVSVGLSGRGVGFAGVGVGGGLAGRLRGCVGAAARVGVGVDGYMRGWVLGVGYADWDC